jgi:hypothetical protein
MTETPTAYEPSKGGRPTKYKPEFCQQLIAYFDIEPWTETDGKRQANRLPTLNNFSKMIGVGISTVYDWIDKDHASHQPKFSDAFQRALDCRKDFLVENGLQGLHNAAYAKFVAVNLTDMRDKAEYDHTIKPIGKIVVNLVKSE